MNKTFSLLLAISSIALSLAAQQLPPVAIAPPRTEEPAWSFRLVNATGLPGNVKFFVDGRNIYQEGYPSGDYTGTMMPSGTTMRIGVQHPACGDGAQEISVNVNPAQQVAIVAYLQPDPPELATGRPQAKSTVSPAKATGEPKKRVLLFHQIETVETPRARTGSVISLCASPRYALAVKNAPPQLPVTFGAVRFSLVYGKQEALTFSLPPGRGTGLPVVVAGKDISTLDLEKNGDTVVIFFDDTVIGAPKCITWMNNRHK